MASVRGGPAQVDAESWRRPPSQTAAVARLVIQTLLTRLTEPGWEWCGNQSPRALRTRCSATQSRKPSPPRAYSLSPFAVRSLAPEAGVVPQTEKI
ncbi:Hypothetical predicted protein [Marmota monax]|uniref:Uncharacterized protein n=1 Tax=Marmota monax TaxID=9995 RepID=A0A5E4CAS4_MARMO|nr:Hypothetical predicted protein [Marmota monax]